jgi:hypothetical protein
MGAVGVMGCGRGFEAVAAEMLAEVGPACAEMGLA